MVLTWGRHWYDTVITWLNHDAPFYFVEMSISEQLTDITHKNGKYVLRFLLVIITDM